MAAIEMGRFVTDTGQVLNNVHDPSACAGRHCVIHNPSDHHMRDWPLHWRDTRDEAAMESAILGGDPLIGWMMAHDMGGHGWFERMCPHGIGHPDPDSLRFALEYYEEMDAGVHGCDGCCAPPEESNAET